MKNSVINEIEKIRKDRQPDGILENANEYRILLREDEYSIAYYFSCPIYNSTDNKLITLDFSKDGDSYNFHGWDAAIKISKEGISISNDLGGIEIALDNIYLDKKNDNEKNFLMCGKQKIYPTFNGIAMEVSCGETGHAIINGSLSSKMHSKKEDGYVSLSCGELKTFAVINAMYGKTASGKIAPANLNFSMLNDYDFLIDIFLEDNLDKVAKFMLEINLYTFKAILDSPIDNMRRDKNFAYSDIAFIEKNEIKQRQLYLRANMNYLQDLRNAHIDRAYLYLPQLSENDVSLDINGLSQYWCCFNLTWDVKPPYGETLSQPVQVGNYLRIDIKKYILSALWDDSSNGYGICLKVSDSVGEMIVATGDNYFMPPILEIKYKK